MGRQLGTYETEETALKVTGETDIASSGVNRESNLMFTLGSDEDQ